MSIHHQGIQSLSFNFENCDGADIRTSFIGLFEIYNIQTHLKEVIFDYGFVVVKVH